MNRRTLSCSVCVALLLGTASAGAQTIDTGVDPSNTGGLAIIPSSQWFFGQYFTVPLVDGATEVSLSSFGFGLTITSRTDVRFGIAEWVGGSRPSPISAPIATGGLLYGAVLHTSDIVTLAPINPFAARMYEYTFATPLNLTAGAMYLAFFDAGGPYSVSTGSVQTRGSVYAGGGSYQLTNNGANRFAPPSDLSFRAAFGPRYAGDITTTPEPASWTLVAGGLTALAALRRRRVRSA